MKTTKYIVAAFSLILGLSSCYDLDVAPYDKVAQGNYWKTEADAKSGVMGVYAQLKNNGAYGYMPLLILILILLRGLAARLSKGLITVPMIFLCKTGKIHMMVFNVPIRLSRMCRAWQLTRR